MPSAAAGEQMAMNYHALALELTDRLSEHVPADDEFLRYVRRVLTPPVGCGFKCGENNPANVLTADNVREMRRLRSDGLTFGQLSIRYGISSKHCWRICKGQAWSWVE